MYQAESSASYGRLASRVIMMADRRGGEMVTDGTCDQSFRLSSRDGLPVVTTPAEIDFRNAAQLGEALASASMDHATVIVDMSANVLCDSSGLAEFIKALKRAQAAGGELRLVMVSSHVPKVFKATGLDRLVKIFGTLSAAVTPSHAYSHDVGLAPE